MRRKAGSPATAAPDVATDILQNRPFARRAEEATVGLLLTTDVVRRWGESLVAPYGVTLQQYNVLRILRGSRPDGLPRQLEKSSGIRSCSVYLISLGTMELRSPRGRLSQLK